jgi:hypothetical protein
VSAIGDFIAKYELLSGIGATVIVGLTVWIVRRATRRTSTSPAVLPYQPLDFELIPLRFEVSLQLPTPEVFVYLQAINYLNRTVALDEIKVNYFKLDSAPHLENIIATDYTVRRRQSMQVRCSRRLIDSEIRGFNLLPKKDRYDASLQVSAKGNAGRKVIKYLNGSNYVHGWISGLPTEPAPKST